MKTFAIDKERRPSRTGSIAIISGTLLSALATGSAFSADLPYDNPPYPPGYYRNSYSPGCYRCSCCGVAPVVEQDVVVEERPPIPVWERIPVAERRWRQREYIERRYYSGPRYGYPGRYRYSTYNAGPGVDPYSYYQGPPGEPRRFSYGGGPYPPAPAAYEAEPRPSYRYIASPRPYEYRPAYEYDYRPSYETEPRPPAIVPSGYYNPGYSE
jgi:hypothetical protein